MPDKKQEEIVLPGALSLMGSVMLRTTFGDQAWQRYGFSSWSDAAFRAAAKFYQDGHSDHAFIEVFRLMEAYLQVTATMIGISNTEKPERVEKIINTLREKGVISDEEGFILHGFRAYRNDLAHSPFSDLPSGIIEGLLLLSVPLIMRLEHIVGKALEPKLKDWIEKLAREASEALRQAG